MLTAEGTLAADPLEGLRLGLAADLGVLGGTGDGKQGCFPPEGPRAAPPAPGLCSLGPKQLRGSWQRGMREVWQFGVLLEELLLLER